MSESLVLPVKYSVAIVIMLFLFGCGTTTQSPTGTLQTSLATSDHGTLLRSNRAKKPVPKPFAVVIKGTLRSKSDGSRLGGDSVHVPQTGTKAVVGWAGNYTLTLHLQQPGAYTVCADTYGYFQSCQGVYLQAAVHWLTLNFSMTRNPSIPLPTPQPTPVACSTQTTSCYDQCTNSVVQVQGTQCSQSFDPSRGCLRAIGSCSSSTAACGATFCWDPCSGGFALIYGANTCSTSWNFTLGCFQGQGSCQ